MEKRDIAVFLEVEDFLDGYDPDPMSMMTMLSQVYKELRGQPEGPGYKE